MLASKASLAVDIAAPGVVIGVFNVLLSLNAASSVPLPASYQPFGAGAGSSAALLTTTILPDQL